MQAEPRHADTLAHAPHLTDSERAIRSRAKLLMIRYATRNSDPVLEADRRTSIADARIGLCLAAGVPEKDIDPASGRDYSAEAYERVRASWQDLARQHGLSRFYDGPAYRKAIGSWRTRRPELVMDDWVVPMEGWARD